MREMKDSGIEWIGEIPKEWATTKMKYVSSIESGTSISKAEYRNDGEYEIIGANGVLGYIDRINVKKQVITTGRVGTIGTAHKIEKAWVTDNVLIVTTKSKVDYEFLYWVLPNFDFIQITSGTAMPLVTASNLSKQVLPFPKLEEQSRIASFLDSKCSEIDSLHSDINEQIETLKEYKKSVITEAVTKGLNPDVEMKDSGVEWIREIPKEWKCKKIKYSCKTRSEKYNLTKGKLNYFALENIKSWNFSFIKTENEYDLNDSQLCYKNDVVFGKLRPYLAKTFLVDYDRCCSSEFAVFHQFDGIPKYFLYVFTSQGFVKIVDDSTAGVKMPRANINFINNVLIPVPSKKEQTEIVNYLDSKCSEIDSIIESKQQQLETLEQYKKSLIYEYVTGKKEVPANA